ncbi:MAG: hypothetical protein WCP20_00635 [Desulfuromonadales bacterium]
MKKILYGITIILHMTLLIACGGGGGGGSAGTPSVTTGGTIKAVIKTSALSTSLKVAGIQLALTVPSGVSPPMLANGTVDSAAAIEITSAAQQSHTLPGVSFTPATASSVGRLTVIGIVADGFGSNDQITIHLNIAVGAFPKESDFSLLTFEARDTNGVLVGGLNPTLTTTIQ